MLAAAHKRTPSSYVSFADMHPACTPANDHRYPYAHPFAYARVPGSKLYEEFHPFGTTSYAANDSGIEVSAKRYRYIGKERDEETGLYHCGARYLAAWLGRWTAADPIGLGDGVNRYAYARGNPVKLVDATGTIGTLSVLQQPNTARLALAKQIGFRQGLYSGTADPVEQGRLLSEIAGLQAQLDRLNAPPTKRAPAQRKSGAALQQQVKSGVATAVRIAAPITAAAEAAGSAEFAEDTSRFISGLAEAAGELRQDLGGNAVDAALTETGIKFAGGTITIGVEIAGGLARAPEQFGEAAATRVRAEEARLRGNQQAAADLTLQATGEAAQGEVPFFQLALLSSPAGRGGGVGTGASVTTQGARQAVGRWFQNLVLGARLRFARPGPPPGKTTLYHQGRLSGGVDTGRTFSTSTNAELEHYNPGGELYRFEVENAVLERGKAQGTILQGYDTHEPTGIVRPETRFLPNSVTPEELGQPALVPRRR